MGNNQSNEGWVRSNKKPKGIPGPSPGAPKQRRIDIRSLPAAMADGEKVYTGYMNGREYRNQLEQNGTLFREEMSKTGAALRKNGMPTVDTFVNGINRYMKNKNWMELFQTFLYTANVVGVFMQVFQGASALEQIGVQIHGELQAQTGLDAPKKFADQVYLFIKKEAETSYGGSTKHFFFLYHPDTDWHGHFHSIIQKGGIAPNFLGMSENLHAICAWMMFIRKHASKSAQKARLHLLIPSYRPMVIRQPFVFSEDLLPLTVHGRTHGRTHSHTHDDNETVWLNLPTMTDLPLGLFELKHIGNIANLPPPPSVWKQGCDWVGAWFVSEEEPALIVLGGELEDDADDADDGAEHDLDRAEERFQFQRATRHVSENSTRRRRNRHGRDSR